MPAPGNLTGLLQYLSQRLPTMQNMADPSRWMPQPIADKWNQRYYALPEADMMSDDPGAVDVLQQGLYDSVRDIGSFSPSDLPAMAAGVGAVKAFAPPAQAATLQQPIPSARARGGGQAALMDDATRSMYPNPSMPPGPRAAGARQGLAGAEATSGHPTMGPKPPMPEAPSVPNAPAPPNPYMPEGGLPPGPGQGGLTTAIGGEGAGGLLPETTMGMGSSGDAFNAVLARLDDIDPSLSFELMSLVKRGVPIDEAMLKIGAALEGF